MKTFRSILVGTVAVFGLGLSIHAEANKKEMVSKMSEEKNMVATFETSQGNFKIELFAKDAPKTVENFVGLAKGTKEFRDPKTGQLTKRPFYDGLIFHRVIPDFMIQGGDPLGTGTGGPGYQFEDEFQSGRKFDKVGLLAMANAGIDTNGSQFFITVTLTPWLTNRHTIFGQVIEGYDVVEKISKVARDGSDRPTTPVVIKKVTIK